MKFSDAIKQGAGSHEDVLCAAYFAVTGELPAEVHSPVIYERISAVCGEIPEHVWFDVQDIQSSAEWTLSDIAQYVRREGY
jgi:hypothetical protein